MKKNLKKQKVNLKNHKINKNNRNEYIKKIKIDKKELVITIIVLILAIILGFVIGKYLFEAVYGKI